MKRWKQWPDSKCPRCGTTDENRSHIMQCRHPDATALWETAIAEVQSWMISKNIDVAIVISVWKGAMNTVRATYFTPMDILQVRPMQTAMIHRLCYETLLFVISNLSCMMMSDVDSDTGSNCTGCWRWHPSGYYKSVSGSWYQSLF